MTVPEPGAVETVERTFTPAEVEQFAALSRDRGRPPRRGRRGGATPLHGLLLATLPTAVGGERNALARTMEYEFHRPVSTGQRVVCEVTTEAVTERDDRYELRSTADGAVDGETVMTAASAGAIMKTDTGL